MIKYEFQIIKNNMWLHINGKTIMIPLQKSAKKKQHGKSSASDQIVAPMPGKITRLMKSAGEKVKKGDSLVIMEAMKMEYTLKAEMDSFIGEIHCTVGDQVQIGQLLMRLQLNETDGENYK